MNFDLRSNHFYILDSSPRDAREAISEKIEMLLSDGHISEDLALKIQRELSASKSRLAAEVSFLLELSPKRISDIKSQYLIREEVAFAEIVDLLEQIETLSCANIAAHFCAQGKADENIFGLLRKAWADLTTNKIRNLVNENRKVAGHPEVSDELTHDAVEALKELHADASLKWLASVPHPGQTLSSVISKTLNETKTPGEFLERVLDKYDGWAIPKLKSFEDEITSDFNRMKEAGTGEPHKAQLDRILANLRQWDEYSQPSQLLHQSKGLDEPRAKRVFGEVRDISIWLANEKNEHELSLFFSKALLEIFPELPISVEKLEEDIKTLTELVQKSKANEDLSALWEVLQKVLKDEASFNRSIIRGDFSAGSNGLAGELYKAVISTREKIHGKPHENEMWSIVRKVAIYLCNEKNWTRAALTITKSLRDLSPPDEILRQLKEDIKSLERTLIVEDFSVAVKSQKTGKARDLAKELLNSAPDEKERTEWESAYTTLSQRRKSEVRKGKVAVIFWGGLILFLIIVGINDKSKKSRSSSSFSSNSRTTSTAYQPSSNNVPGLEIKPPVGTNVLAITGLRWCTFEKERLDFMARNFPESENEVDPIRRWNGSILTQSVIDSYDNRVNDYNSRCAKAQYYEKDLATVKFESSMGQAKRVQEAKQIMTGWNVKFRFKE